MLCQRTIKNEASARGVGLHSGVKSTITLKPAKINTGVVFIRIDLGGKKIRALSKYVKDVTLCTSIGNKELKISTVEHLLSALSALGIDNLIIELDSGEVPIMDGSAAPFVFLIQSAGILEQEAYKKFFVLKDTVTCEYKDSWARLIPYNGFKINLEIDFEHKKVKESGQQLTMDFSEKSYLKEISRARTFGNLKDVETMKLQNLALGANFNNAIALGDDDDILNEDDMRYRNEFVKHKMLDIIGDLYLLGANLVGEYQGYKTGHALNNKLLKALLKNKKSWEIKTYEKENAPISFITHDWQKTFG